MITPQLKKITKLGAGTVKEVSQLAMAALVKGDQKGRGIWLVPHSWKIIFQMPMITEAQIPALVTRHLMESRKERTELLYGFRTSGLEADLVEGGDTITVGKDWDSCPKNRRFIPMKFGDTDGRLILSHRDAVTLNLKPY